MKETLQLPLDLQDLFTSQETQEEECFILIDPATGLFHEHHNGFSAAQELLEKANALSPAAALYEKTEGGWTPC